MASASATYQVSNNTSGPFSIQINSIDVKTPEANRAIVRRSLLAKLNRIHEERHVVRNTCGWIAEDLGYWQDQHPVNPIMIIQGGAGKGKTHISSYIISNLEESEPASLVLRYFCEKLKARRNTALVVILDFLYQLLEFDHSNQRLHEEINERLTDKQRNFTKSVPDADLVSALIKGLRQILNAQPQSCDRKQVHLVLDGLDECDVASRSSILDFIQKLCSSNVSNGPLVTAIVVTRPFNFNKKDMYVVDLDHSSYREKTMADIQTFVRDRIEKMPEFGDQAVDRLVEMLSKRAAGTFLWIYLAMSKLAEEPTVMAQLAIGTDSRMLDQLLQQGLHPLYNQMLLDSLHGGNIDANDTAKVICCVSTAIRPLSAAELGVATGLCPGVVSIHLGRCRHLLARSRGPLECEGFQLVHLSLKEYLHEDISLVVLPASIAIRILPRLSATLLWIRINLPSTYLWDAAIVLLISVSAQEFLQKYPALLVGAVALAVVGAWRDSRSIAVCCLVGVLQTLLARCVSSIFMIHEREANDQFFFRCLEILMHPNQGLKKDWCKIGDLGVSVQDKPYNDAEATLPVLVSYACQYWVQHLKEGGAASSSNGLTDRHCGVMGSFLEKHLLCWIETMAGTKRVTELILAVIKAEQILLGAKQQAKAKRKPQTPLDVLSILHDTKRTLLGYRSMIEMHPMTIYSSALLFSPRNSTLRRLFDAEVEQYDLISGVKDQWSSDTRVLAGGTSPSEVLAFSPSGQKLAMSTFDSIRIWDLKTGKFDCFDDHFDFISMAFSPDETQLAVGTTRDDIIRFIDLESGTTYVNKLSTALWNERQEASRGADHITYSPDGKLLAWCAKKWRGYDVLRIWDFAEQRCIFEADARSCSCIRFSPVGEKLICLSPKGVKLWERDRHGARASWSWEISDAPVEGESVVFSKTDAQVMYLSRYSYVEDEAIQHIVIRSSADGALKQRVGLPDDFHSLKAALSPEAQFIATRNPDDDHDLMIWDIATAQSHEGVKRQVDRRLLRHSERVVTYAISPDGSTIGTASKDRGVRIWETKLFMDEKPMTGGRHLPVSALAMSSDERVLACAEADGPTIRLIDLETGTIDHMPQAPDAHFQISSLTFMKNDKALVVGATGGIHVWSLASSNIDISLHDIPCSRSTSHHWDPVRMAMSAPPALLKREGERRRQALDTPTNQELAAFLMSDGRNIEVWNTRSWVLDFELSIPDQIQSAELSPNGEDLNLVLEDGLRLKWVLKTGNHYLMAGLSNNTSGANVLNSAQELPDAAIESSRNGKKIAYLVETEGSESSSHTGKLVEIQDVETGHVQLQIDLGSKRLIAFSPNGKRAVAILSDCTIATWDLTEKQARYISNLILSREENGTVRSIAYPSEDIVVLQYRLPRSSTAEFIMEVWNIATGQRLRDFTNAFVEDFTMSCDSSRLAFFCAPTFRLWEIGGDAIMEMPIEFRHGEPLLFLSGGRKILLRSGPDFILWSYDEPQTVHIVTYQAVFHDIRISPDSRRLAATTEDGKLFVWNLLTRMFEAQTRGCIEEFARYGYVGVRTGHSWEPSRSPIYSVSLCGRWVLRDGRKILYLPEDHQPRTRKNLAIGKSTIAIGRGHSGPTVLRLKSETVK